VRSIFYVTTDTKNFDIFERFLRGRCSVRAVSSPAEALRFASGPQYDAILFDPILTSTNGKHLLSRLVSTPTHLPIFILTSEYCFHFLRFALEQGVCGYYLIHGGLNKVLRDIELATSLAQEGLVTIPGICRECGTFECALSPLLGHAASQFVGQSPAVILLRRTVHSMRESFSPVVIHGESGSGKELVAHMVHDNSPASNGPFKAVNVSCICNTLAESQLFGTVRGAFTGAESCPGLFEQANGGTLFLDEIGELNVTMQAKLLRVLEEHMVTRLGSAEPRPIQVRIICATNKRLATLVKSGAFRADLYYRLDALRIRVPPLRNRAEDIPLLAAYRLRNKQKKLSFPALKRLHAYHWPGNVRQLFHCLDRAAGEASSGVIHPDHIDF